MTRRRALQSLLLVLLAAAAGWLYLSRQEGVQALMTALLGREAPAPASAPAPAPAAPSRKPPPAPAPSKQPPPAPAPEPASESVQAGAAATPPRAIPAQPVQGEIRGARFRVDAARIESGVLRLRQREPALELAIVLPVNPWRVPAGRAFEVLAPEQRVVDTPLVRVSAKHGGDAEPREYAAGYTLWLEFGRERNGMLPGRLHLALPDAEGSRVAGTFTAAIRGFRFVDGKPDLAADSVETFQYLALRELLREDPDRPLTGLSFGAGRLVRGAPGKPAIGRLEVRYRANGETVRRAFGFVKENGRWRTADGGTKSPSAQ